jgi:hypothetical protein
MRKKQALISDGTILAVPSVQWLGNKIVVCDHGHRASYRAFAQMKSEAKSVTTNVRQVPTLVRLPTPVWMGGFFSFPSIFSVVLPYLPHGLLHV